VKTYKFEKKDIIYILGIVISSALSLVFSYGISFFLDNVIIQRQSNVLAIWIISMLVLVIISGITSIILGQYFPIRVQLKKSINISQDVMKGILNSPQSIYQGNEKGYYINLITSSSFSYGDVYGQFYIDLFGNVVFAMMVIVAASLINLYFGILFILYIPICWLTIKGPSKKISEFQKE